MSSDSCGVVGVRRKSCEADREGEAEARRRVVAVGRREFCASAPDARGGPASRPLAPLVGGDWGKVCSFFLFLYEDVPSSISISRSRRGGAVVDRLSRKRIRRSSLRRMGGRWNLFRFHLHKVLCVVLMIHLLSDECLSINLEVESDPYGALQNWNPSDDDPCNWTGVHCADGKVVTLNLKEFSLRGILAPELGNLSHLRAL
ncbi:hypothetical protein BHE74_00039381 [Ensete ventricosum]|nr:hypothetical protein BHE74_00039381 [Ensete ventricosum]